MDSALLRASRGLAESSGRSEEWLRALTPTYGVCVRGCWQNPHSRQVQQTQGEPADKKTLCKHDRWNSSLHRIHLRPPRTSSPHTLQNLQAVPTSISGGTCDGREAGFVVAEVEQPAPSGVQSACNSAVVAGIQIRSDANRDTPVDVNLVSNSFFKDFKT